MPCISIEELTLRVEALDKEYIKYLYKHGFYNFMVKVRSKDDLTKSEVLFQWDIAKTLNAVLLLNRPMTTYVSLGDEVSPDWQNTLIVCYIKTYYPWAEIVDLRYCIDNKAFELTLQEAPLKDTVYECKYKFLFEAVNIGLGKFQEVYRAYFELIAIVDWDIEYQIAKALSTLTDWVQTVEIEVTEEHTREGEYTITDIREGIHQMLKVNYPWVKVQGLDITDSNKIKLVVSKYDI